MLIRWAVQLMGKVFVLNAYRDVASNIFCKWSAVAAWKTAHPGRQLGDTATIWLLENDKEPKNNILYSNPNESHPEVSVFIMFEEGVQHTQIFRIYVDVL